MLNRAFEMGRLTKDPELRTTSNGKKVCSWTLAVDRDRTKEDTDFIDCVAWDGRAEFVSKYFRKGKLMLVAGPLQSRKWTDKNGNSRTNWEINVLDVYFCDQKTQEPDVRFDEYTGDETLPF